MQTIHTSNTISHVKTKNKGGRPKTKNNIQVIFKADRRLIDLLERVRGNSRSEWIRNVCRKEALRQIRNGAADSHTLE